VYRKAIAPSLEGKSCSRLARAIYVGLPRKRSALVITDTELRLIASAAIIGDSSCPVNDIVCYARLKIHRRFPYNLLTPYSEDARYLCVLAQRIRWQSGRPCF
jgi:hypothetical protein